MIIHKSNTELSRLISGVFLIALAVGVTHCRAAVSSTGDAWAVIDRVIENYQTCSAYDYRVRLTSSEMDQLIAEKMASQYGISLKPSFVLFSANGEKMPIIKAELTSLKEPYRTAAENKINELAKVYLRVFVRLYAGVNPKIAVNVLRMARDSGRVDIIKNDNNVLDVELNELNEPISDKNLRSVRLRIDKFQGIVNEGIFSFGPGENIETKLRHSQQELPDGRKVNFIAEAHVRQTTFTTGESALPHELTFKLDDYRFMQSSSVKSTEGGLKGGEAQTGIPVSRDAVPQSRTAVVDPQADAPRREALQARLGLVLTASASDVLRQDCAGALRRLSAAINDPEMASVTNNLVQAHASVGRLVTLTDAVLAGFEREKGQETDIEFVGGKKLKLTVVTVDVEARKVTVRQALGSQGYSDRSFPVEELTSAEKYRRLGSEVTPELQLMRGFLACTVKNWGLAEKEFSQAGPGFGAVLADVVRQRTSPKSEKTTATQVAKSGDSKLTEKMPPVATIIRQDPIESPVTRTNSEARGASPATGKDEPVQPVVPKEATEENVDQALTALRSQLDRPAKYSIASEGIVLNLGENPRLQDIRALAGLPIANLDIQQTAVEDLAPLAGMPLKQLNLSGTMVRDLTPLGKLITMERLKINSIRVPVSDLTPLGGLLRLKSLQLSGCKMVYDLTPLGNLEALETLDVAYTQVSNLSPLQKLPHLQHLNLRGCQRLQNLSPLATMKLKSVALAHSGVADLFPLRGLTLNNLVVGGMPVSDWTPLTGLSFQRLEIEGKMKSLQSLKGVSATSMIINGAHGARPEDFEELPECLPNIQQVWIQAMPYPPSACPEFVFRFPSLKSIRWVTEERSEELSAEEFRAKYLIKKEK